MSLSQPLMSTDAGGGARTRTWTGMCALSHPLHPVNTISLSHLSPMPLLDALDYIPTETGSILDGAAIGPAKNQLGGCHTKLAAPPAGPAIRHLQP